MATNSTVRGTKIYEGSEAVLFHKTLRTLEDTVLSSGFEPLILPALSDPQLWIDRSGKEIESQMWRFADRKGRPMCLMPEATAVVAQLYDEHWDKAKAKPVRVFYTVKAYRYERPQAGRYREFTQFGVEILGPAPEQYEEEAQLLLQQCLEAVGVSYDFNKEVKRGLSYYSRDGFEASVETLGAQKQIAGGGTYQQGCGWAIGLDRLVLALQN